VVGRAGDVALAEQDQRSPGVGAPQVVRLHGQRAQDRGVDALRAHRGDDRLLALAGALRLLDQHRPGPAVRGGDHQPGELGEVRVVQLGDGQHDEAGPALAQVARAKVGAVAGLGDRLLHPLARGRGDEGVAVHHVRDRLDRDAGPLGHVLQCWGHLSGPPFP
jgi:hypothetical protein